MPDGHDALGLLEEIAADFGHEPDVVLGTMFRNPGLRTGDKIFVFLGHGGRLIAKLPGIGPGGSSTRESPNR
nr:hypothetical protein GCM10020093_009830 [Planobispora longispora]